MQSTYDHRTGRVDEHSTGVPWVLQAVREDDPGRLWPLGDIGEAHSVTHVLELRSDPETPLAVFGHPLFGPRVGQEHWRVGPNPKRLRYLVAGINRDNGWALEIPTSLDMRGSLLVRNMRAVFAHVVSHSADELYSSMLELLSPSVY